MPSIHYNNLHTYLLPGTIHVVAHQNHSMHTTLGTVYKVTHILASKILYVYAEIQCVFVIGFLCAAKVFEECRHKLIPFQATGCEVGGGGGQEGDMGQKPPPPPPHPPVSIYHLSLMDCPCFTMVCGVLSPCPYVPACHCYCSSPSPPYDTRRVWMTKLTCHPNRGCVGWKSRTTPVYQFVFFIFIQSQSLSYSTFSTVSIRRCLSPFSIQFNSIQFT